MAYDEFTATQVSAVDRLASALGYLIGAVEFHLAGLDTRGGVVNHESLSEALSKAQAIAAKRQRTGAKG